MSKAIVRFLAILGALWLIGMVIVLVAQKAESHPRRFSKRISSRHSWKMCRRRRRRNCC